METLLNFMAFGLASALWIMAFAGLRTAVKIMIRAERETAAEVQQSQSRGAPLNSATTQYSPAA